MPKLNVKDIPALDGEYEADFDVESLTTAEVRIIKRLSGVRLGEIEEALRVTDMDLLVAYAVVFMVRGGKDLRMVETLVESAKLTSFEYDLTDLETVAEEGEVRPPDSQTVSGSGNELDALPSGSESSGSSANGSRSDSGSSVSVPSRTGSLL